MEINHAYPFLARFGPAAHDGSCDGSSSQSPWPGHPHLGIHRRCGVQCRTSLPPAPAPSTARGPCRPRASLLLSRPASAAPPPSPSSRTGEGVRPRAVPALLRAWPPPPPAAAAAAPGLSAPQARLRPLSRITFLSRIKGRACTALVLFSA